DQAYVVCGSSEQVIKVMNGLLCSNNQFNEGTGDVRGRGGRGRGSSTRGRGRGRGGRSARNSTCYKWRPGPYNSLGGCRRDTPCPEIRNMIIMGDSIALRMVKAIEDETTGRFLLCCGGLTMKSLMENLTCNYLYFKHKDVVLLVGTNDLLQDSDVDSTLAFLDDIILELYRKKCGNVYVCQIPMSPIIEKDWKEKFEKLNAGILERESVENNVTVIQCSDVFLKDGKVNDGYFEKCCESKKLDNIHPNTEALRKLFDFICCQIT
ncbi:Leukocyte receptor cluster member 8-like protein, partial [Frankliniella fusca]